MQLFKNSRGEILRLDAIEMICPADRWVGTPCGDPDTTHVVCTVGAEFPLYDDDFERLMGILNSSVP